MGVDLVIVRHGRTAWNRDVRFRGKMDLPLDEVGLAQAGATARAVRARWPDLAAVCSSPLQRALQTAEPIAAALGLAVQHHPALLDVDYGAWTGLTPAEVEVRDPERYCLWMTAPQQVEFPGGDSLHRMQTRLLDLLEELARAFPGRGVALVSHQLVNRVLLCTLLGLSLDGYWRIGQDNSAINLARYEDGVGQVLCLNDTCHLVEKAR